MAGTILPIVYRECHKGKLWSPLLFHAVGCVAGATCLGCLLGAIGMLIPWHTLRIDQRSTELVASGLVGLLYSIRELGIFQVRVPQSTWQVPEVWRRVLPPRASSLIYGLALGFGVATRIPVSTFYVVVVWAVLLGSPLLGGLGMAAFGLGRASPLMWMAWVLNSNDDTFRHMSVLRQWQPGVHIVNGLALGFAGSCLLVAALGLHATGS